MTIRGNYPDIDWLTTKPRPKPPEETGPNAFAGMRLFNQRVWDNSAEQRTRIICDALATGGFDRDCISREVGNYEGQIMAIRADLVDKDAWNWRINEAGKAYLRAAGKGVPRFLPVMDDWRSRVDHEKAFEYCAFEETRYGKPVLKLFKDAIPSGAKWGMEPILRRSDAEALRDYLDDWLARTR